MRDIKQLHPQLQVAIAKLMELCEKNNLKIGISECLRTVAEQDALYAKGRTTSDKIVTNAKGSTYSSMHQWGVAFDFYRNDGKKAYDNSDGFFDKVGRLGKSIGLEWGGSWISIVDKPHFQLPDWGSTPSILKSQYGTPEKFFATWTDDIPTEYGVEMPGEKFRLVKDSFLRPEPKVDRNKVSYAELSVTLKKKCTNKAGYALMKAGETFTRTRSYRDDADNKWMQLKSGYWIPVIFDGERRVEKI